MKLSKLINSTDLTHRSQGIDIDVASNITPAIGKHISSLETLLGLLPGSDELCNKLGELKTLLAAKLPQSSPVIEVHEPAATILDYDANKTLGQQRAHIHGVGSASIGYLPSKIIREVGFVDDNIKEIDDLEGSGASPEEITNKYKELSRWTDQMLRSATTLKNGIGEMSVKKQLGNIFPPDTKITEKEHNDDLDEMISEHHVIEMYETMKVGLGDKAWVAITKRLKSQGHDPALVEKMIDRAIMLKSS